MKNIEIKFLSHMDIQSLNIQFDSIIDIVEKVLIEHGRGFFVNPKKPAIHPNSKSFFHAMPAYLPRTHAAGIKWVSGYSDNPSKGLPAITGVIVSNDPETGFPVAIMDCSWITAMRTAAVSAISAKYLAKKESKTLGIVGAGIQGRAHSLALKKVVPSINKIKAFDINKNILEKYREFIKNKINADIEIVNSNEEAIRDSDIVITATGKLDEPIFFKTWIKSGALIMPVHTGGWDRDLPLVVDKFYVDDWQQFKETHCTAGGYYGKLPAPYAQLGEVLIGKKNGRENNNEIILIHNLGIAINDVEIAKRVREIAEERDVGENLVLMNLENEVFQ